MRRALLVASNRGPVRFERRGGELVPRRGAGGLVTALTGVLHEAEGTWVAAAMSEGDRERVAGTPDGRLDVVLDDVKYRLRLLSFDPETYDRAYNMVSNRLLWFLHHYLWDVPRWPRFGARARESWQAYRAVNRAFAEALADEAEGGPRAALVQDYHLSLVPAELRSLAPDATIAYFHHVPFAGPGYMRLVPLWMRHDLLAGLLGADLIGFHTKRWADDFLSTVKLLPGARVNLRRRVVEWRGRTVRVGVYPIAVDAESLRAQAEGPEVERKAEKLRERLGDRRLLLRVDRTELSKNVLRGFLAYEELLRRHPEWERRVTFLAHLTPSRRDLEEYRVYTAQCLETAERINDELGARDWSPIEVDVSDDFDGVLAAYRLYDVLLVNPIFDGMNLVAKEGPLLNRNDGALVLSRNAGAAHELGRHALEIDPVDITGTAEAIRAALEMPEHERRRRARALRRAAAARTPADWIRRQLEDLGLGPP